MNDMDQILMREHHLENKTLSLKAKGLFSTPILYIQKVSKSSQSDLP